MASDWTERRVVITGLGVVSPLGNDLETFWNALLSGKCGIGPITSFDVSNYDTKIAAEVKNFDPAPAFPSPKEIRRTDLFAQYGVHAAWQALRDAGLNGEQPDCDEIGVFIGSGSTTSAPYPINFPDLHASTTSWSTTSPPRPVLIRIAPSFINASVFLLMNPRVSGVRFVCRLTTSARRKTSSRVAIRVRLYCVANLSSQ